MPILPRPSALPHHPLPSRFSTFSNSSPISIPLSQPGVSTVSAATPGRNLAAEFPHGAQLRLNEPGPFRIDPCAFEHAHDPPQRTAIRLRGPLALCPCRHPVGWRRARVPSRSSWRRGDYGFRRGTCCASRACFFCDRVSPAVPICGRLGTRERTYPAPANRGTRTWEGDRLRTDSTRRRRGGPERRLELEPNRCRNAYANLIVRRKTL